MSSNIIGKLLMAQIQAFVNDFSYNAQDLFLDEATGRLIHPGEFGMHRESCIRNFLGAFLPDIYGVSQGFIIGQDGIVSHQCDVIIYHKQYSPYFHTPEGQRFFPIECVIAVGEVKSKVNGAILDDALQKLSCVKIMREKISSAVIASCRPNRPRDFNPHNDIRDQIVTFLICDEVECSGGLLAERVKKTWDSSKPRHRVNLITSIKSGTYLYKLSDARPYMYPTDPDGNTLPVQLRTPKSPNSHIALFVRYLTMAIEDTTVLYPELTLHLKGQLSCEVVDF
ncbi:hypothetical protein OH458_21755 [Vibrio sp. MarTm2]|uniref:DUF6602 domain-containing protein n=1 Tax=Vibrio sp. MarTm2 TaxID=2998831 RepID=UPI0022CD71BD|nr:DUF6602 domain-containing protein [Vibrio sp. MarTm2]MDA0130693.1 hypothetical protein [Vibrio sp. MarTm2]